ncbi:MAG: class I SAM-dependent methyltransferase [Deltaproteobacteria bacterium]|nr:class I SAM-dependent methyltransferase [Deltaproteobacteria bacterium]
MSDDDARETWDARYAAGRFDPTGPPGWLEELGEELPSEGVALDLAAGAGRVSIWLARRGLSVEAVDISPVGLALAREAASDEGVNIKTRVADLSSEQLPEGPYRLIACFHYRQPGLLHRLVDTLTPGGVLLGEVATVKNLERHPRPSRRWLVEPNELLREARDLDVVYYREAWLGGRHLARIVARAASRVG